MLPAVAVEMIDFRKAWFCVVGIPSSRPPTGIDVR
jgi:hypothetical protein